VTTVILIRHAHSVANEKGILAGRASGIALSQKGLVQAAQLKDRLGNLSFREIRMSPLERCEATLQPWMQSRELSQKLITFDNDLSEVDYGKWTGKKLSVLALKKEWRVVQNSPSAMIFPEGESLANAQKRAERALMKSIKRTGNGIALLVSHGDIIKSIIATTLGLDLDKFQKIVIDPASISVLDYNKNSFRLLHLNDLSSNFEFLAKSKRNTKTLVGGGSGRL
jgi:probable phosphoglycerate mutase